MSSSKKPEKTKAKPDSKKSEQEAPIEKKHKDNAHNSSERKKKTDSTSDTVSGATKSIPEPVPSKIVFADSSKFPDWPGSPRTPDEIVETPKTKSPESKRAESKDSTGAATSTPAASADAQVDNKPSVNDYTFGKTLGKGAYGDVVLATHNSSGKVFAAKKIEKKHLLNSDKAKYALTERKILSSCDHPNIIKLVQSFRSADKNTLYYIMELAPNGTLQNVLKQFGVLNNESAVFITAEIVSALEYLHEKQNTIHRDLKPENILLSTSNHVKVTDFGTSKELGNDRNARSDSFVGTAEFISPELLDVESRTAFKSSDLWALGCILYRMTTGRFAFRGATDLITFEQIQAGIVKFPSNLPANTRDLIEKLLMKDPSERLGAKSFDELKKHPFFAGIDWATLSSTPAPIFKTSDSALTWDEKTSADTSISTELTVESAQIKFKDHLNKKERVLHVGSVDKLFSEGKKRHRVMVLTDGGRILYFNSDHELKGQLALPTDKNITIDVQGEEFHIKLERKIYKFTTHKDQAKTWKKHISNSLKK